MTWEGVVGLFFAILFGLFPGFHVFNWVKAKFGLQDQAANQMVIGVSFLLTGLALYLTESLFPASGIEFTLVNLLGYVGLVYKSSQLAYSRFKEGRDISSPNYNSEMGEFPDL